jgi:glycosyltransferase involved in cell wall biosynthesis/Tfp pilus assembly protein PilF
MISGNKNSHVPHELYSKRIEVARWFDEHSKMPFDVYGKPPFALSSYRGVIADGQKLAVLKTYRFSLCFENTDDPVLSAGYVTEKILDCLEARTIPIYLGASNIGQYIPSECFIDFRTFSNLQSLDNYLHSITADKYKKYIDKIDDFVCSGGLRKYSETNLYQQIIQTLTDEQALDARYYKNDMIWHPGPSPAVRQKQWNVSCTPEMWTWKHLSKAHPPLLENGQIMDRRPIDPTHIAETSEQRGPIPFLTGKKPTIRVLAAGRKYSSGTARRGYDYGWWNLFDSLHRFDNIDTHLFDCDTEAQQRGIAGMSERLEEIIYQEKPDILFYCPSSDLAGILNSSLQFIADSTDTQTVIWMNPHHDPHGEDAALWASCANYIITTSPETARHYTAAGFGAKIIPSQWGFNPFTYASTPSPRMREISFCGTAKGSRPDILETMKRSGFSIDVFGSGWKEDSFIPFYDMVRIFSQSRINLNLGDTPDFATRQITKRTFEVPGCGGFLLTAPADHLEKYYEPGKEMVLASSLEELIDQCRYYMDHEQERNSIAHRGYKRTLAEHTWTHRLRDIFKHIGIAAIPKQLPVVSSPSSFIPFSPAGITAFAERSAQESATEKAVDPDDNPIDASISVMAFNKLEYTRQCIESILHYTKGPYELLLSDNGSTDGTFEYFQRVKSFHPHTRIIKHFQNREVEDISIHIFSLARGKYIVGASNDILVHEGWLDNFIHQIESAPDVGMVGPRSNNVSGPQMMPTEYNTVEAYHAFAAEWCKQHKGTHFAIHRLVGMVSILKKAVLERIGGFDPYLPTNGRDGGYGFSDDDFSLRLRLGGYRSLVANDVFIHHFGSVTVKQHRPDLFGAPQNINKEKYMKKLQQNDRVTIEPSGELTVKPYSLNDPIPLAENTVIRSPRICIVESDSGVAGASGHSIRHASLADFYHTDVFSHGSDSLQPLLTQTITKGEYDFIVLLDKRLGPSPKIVRALIDTALCHPDVAVMVPLGNFAPSTHAHRTENGKIVEIIQNADMSFCVINVKIIRPFAQGLAHKGNDEQFFFFLQRRIRGEGYFIAKTNTIVADSDLPCMNHPYDNHPLPEKWVQEKKYAEAIAIYKDDLIQDPTFVESLYQLAYIAKEQHQSSEAIHYAEDALRIDPHHIQSLLLLSRIFLEKGDLKRAQAFVSQANMKQPGNPEVQKVVELYEAQLTGQTGFVRGDTVPEIPSLIHPEFIQGMTSIIIPVQSVHLHECISSINRYTEEPHEIILLDRGAAPKLKKLILKTAKENPRCKVAKIEGKVNFTQSLNIGINQSTGEYLVLLFDDVVVGEDWLSDMRACLHNGKEVGIVGAMSDDASSLQRVEGIPFKSQEERTAFRERNRHRRIRSRNLDGFCLLFRRDLLSRIGLFDEIFKWDKHAFDDLCVRAVLEGHHNVIAGNVFVHNGGGINRLMSRDKTVFDEKWIGLDASTPLAEKVSIANAMETARSQYQKGAIDDAVLTLIRQAGFSPSEKRLFYQLAEILLAEHRFQDALDALKGAEAAEAEKDEEYYELLGYGNEGLGFYEIAEEHADKALAMDGRSANALNLKGILAYRKADLNTAEEFFRRAIEADPGYGDPYTNMGMLRWSNGRKEEAVDLFEKGFILWPDIGDIITAYYHAISSLDRYERAETVFREARTAYPENRRILFLLIDILLKQGKFQEAMKEVEKAMVQFGMDEGILAAAMEIRRRVGAKSIVKGKTTPTLSVCMIVKNEERNLAYCLNSLSPVADEMIVVDTGSTDKTKEIAEAFGAHVYDFEWTNDFAAARNHSLAQAQGDWILVMDADEVISYQDYDKLKKLISRKDGITYNLITRNYVNKTAGDGWVCNDNTYLHEQAGRGWFPSSKVRLFPNDEKIRFEEPIHELVEYSLLRMRLGIRESGIPVHHYGELDTKKATAKDAQYYELGIQKMKKSGGDFRSVWELAVQAAELGKIEESIELWHKVLEFKQREAAAYFNLANHYQTVGKYEDSYACARKAYALDPKDQSSVLSYAMSEFLAGDIQRAKSTLEGFLNGTDTQTSHVGLLALSCLLSGEKDRGLKYLRGLVRKKYDCVHYLKNLSQTLIAAGNPVRAKSLLAAAVEIKFFDRETLALLAQCEGGAGK